MAAPSNSAATKGKATVSADVPVRESIPNAVYLAKTLFESAKFEGLLFDKVLTNIPAPKGDSSSSSFSAELAKEHTVAGPSFKEFPPVELAQIYPLDPNICLLYQLDDVDWGQWVSSGIASWPIPDDSWSAWVMRMVSYEGDLLNRVGLKEAVMASRYEMSFNLPLLSSISLFWSPVSNTFHFPDGQLSVTIEDVVALLGLPPTGEIPYPGMAKLTHDFIIPPRDASYSAFLAKFYRPGSIVLDDERIAFFLYFICKYLVCTSSKQILSTFLPLAIMLARGRRLALAPLVVAHLYRALGNIHYAGFQNSAGGPFWVLQIWAYAYFPGLAPTPVPRKARKTEQAIPFTCYGEAFRSGVFPNHQPFPIQDCLNHFFHPRGHGPPLNFTPFAAKSLGGSMFLHLDPSSKEVFPREEEEEWASILMPRELIWFSGMKRGLEAYTPAQVARQYGLVQAVPMPPYFVSGASWSNKLANLPHLEEFARKQRYELQCFTFKGFTRVARSLPAFDQWWDAYYSMYASPSLVDKKKRRLVQSFEASLKGRKPKGKAPRHQLMPIEATPPTRGPVKEEPGATLPPPLRRFTRTSGKAQELSDEDSLPISHLAPQSKTSKGRQRADPKVEEVKKKKRSANMALLTTALETKAERKQALADNNQEFKRQIKKDPSLEEMVEDAVEVEQPLRGPEGSAREGERKKQKGEDVEKIKKEEVEKKKRLEQEDKEKKEKQEKKEKEGKKKEMEAEEQKKKLEREAKEKEEEQEKKEREDKKRKRKEEEDKALFEETAKKQRLEDEMKRMEDRALDDLVTSISLSAEPIQATPLQSVPLDEDPVVEHGPEEPAPSNSAAGASNSTAERGFEEKTPSSPAAEASHVAPEQGVEDKAPSSPAAEASSRTNRFSALLEELDSPTPDIGPDLSQVAVQESFANLLAMLDGELDQVLSDTSKRGVLEALLPLLEEQSHHLSDSQHQLLMFLGKEMDFLLKEHDQIKRGRTQLTQRPDFSSLKQTRDTFRAEVAELEIESRVAQAKEAKLVEELTKVREELKLIDQRVQVLSTKRALIRNQSEESKNSKAKYEALEKSLLRSEKIVASSWAIVKQLISNCVAP